MSSALPATFLWGTSNAAYQIEGGWDADGKAPSVWDTAYRNGSLRVRDGADLGRAADEYHRLDEDLDLMRDLGAQAHRFSISWPRVVTDAEGHINESGLDYYDRLVDGLLARGILPAACLYHWDTPQWLEERCGGWMGRESAEQFARYAEIVAQRLGDRVDQWYTMNEPSHPAIAGYVAGFLPPMRSEGARGLDAVHNILLAHGMAVRALRSAKVSGRIGTILSVAGVQPATCNPADVQAAETARRSFDRLMLDPLMGKGHAPLIREQVQADGACREGDMDVIAEPLDILGVNWYSNMYATTPERAPMFFESGNDNEKALHAFSSMLGEGNGVAIVPGPGRRWWSPRGFRQETPGGLRATVEWVHESYPDHPRIIITENGRGTAYPSAAEGLTESTESTESAILAESAGETAEDAGQLQASLNDAVRIRALAHNIRDLHALASEGIAVDGYYVWSNIDNIQWMDGFSERFGLVHVDAATMKRTPKDSFAWYRDVVRHNGDLEALDAPVAEERFDGDVNGIELGDVPNARGIGGLRTVSDHYLRSGFFFRSAGLNFMKPEDAEELRRLGVHTVIDLRDPWEIGTWPYQLDDDIEVLRIGLLGSGVADSGVSGGGGEDDGAGNETGDSTSKPLSARMMQGLASVQLPELYRRIAFDHADKVIAVLQVLARSEGRPVLIHCTAGKDRTGIVSAVLLGLLGVEDALIVSNYAQSAANLTSAFKAAISQSLPGKLGKIANLQGAAAALLASPGETMQGLLNDMRGRYGTVTQYCLANGMSEEEIATLRTLFIE
ncbi:MAG: family 1 glycosylhydrolase [Bifidobacterium tibiigranuli]|jgi:beta-glucosidase/6-phospho-beta-glucosidase/beta-galactosidase/protein tyrosine/serine phosphatase|uniref:family 1 glycosylhydrolase n=1 Tax=Bifidobacterium tibiigranuli TaxID=2172043 RepID=UPI0023565930|nr:family 1 glycosylhydrolase [Bifidobacterium tibiigranuli]MCH3975465.1 family 1 glycosylhydrolase [Bifidobacterium tibiigranuli]MCH4190562.1 family 1 glycosylhydrolase [Bifidobacterium tibiigranuli]MCH4204176.1 family 1 glycosylhydrolase [Bifidobacterium tibiigranuli]MCH4274627.1 family 1 glycosylhydrolase [Bifidobacterium tibiigranuli]MCI1791328.1 family 1 glycosylhydrolase [Bifidobacterium tibiigranuli]